MQQSVRAVQNRIRNTTDLTTFFQQYQITLQNIINNDSTAPRHLLSTITTILGMWDDILEQGPRDRYDYHLVVHGTSAKDIVSNLTSLAMRSVADFLLTQPNTAQHSRHFVLIPGKTFPRSHHGNVNARFCENPPFQHLNRCITFANLRFTRMRAILPELRHTPDMPLPPELAQLFAIVQDEAHFELAFARHKTLPGMMARYGKLCCDCADRERCSAMHVSPREHLERARRRVALVREYAGKMERGGVRVGWMERWLRAFDTVAEKIERGLKGWKEDDEQNEEEEEEEGILKEPLLEFEDVEFVFQYPLLDGK